ncbi:hypothetical protein HPB48_009481 [Haemaphysalis longicornis]|uniref:Uncharacterized protein n=1 Tax=Haemaphysalis longicornis TaxID=44386 RepID=A0A9J6GGG0_HAELO|nr:hypothetical protein HPB48_009481 [Haemaphysalis longicornis]
MIIIITKRRRCSPELDKRKQSAHSFQKRRITRAEEKKPRFRKAAPRKPGARARARSPKRKRQRRTHRTEPRRAGERDGQAIICTAAEVEVVEAKKQKQICVETEESVVAGRHRHKARRDRAAGRRLCRGKHRLGKALLYGSRGKHYAPVSSPGLLSPPPTAKSERRPARGEKGEGRLYSISSRLPSETRTWCLLLLAPSHTTGTPKKAGKTKRNRVRSRRQAHAAGAVRFLGQLSLRAQRKARCCGGRREQDGPPNIAFHLWITPPPPARLCPRGVLLRKGSTENSNNIGRAWQGSRHRGDAARATRKKQGSRGGKRVQLPDGKQRRDAEKWNGKSRNGRTGRADTIRERKTRTRASQLALSLSLTCLSSRALDVWHSLTQNTDREHEHKSRPVDNAGPV